MKQATKKLLITGGNGEIGGAIVKIFKQHDYDVIAPSRELLNLSDTKMIHDYMKNFNDVIDSFIHCAGFNEPKPFSDIAPADFYKTLTINSLAFYEMTQALFTANKLNSNACVLGISSIYGSIARKKRFSYVSSKYCLNGMVKSLALELAHLGIRVNSLSPGFVATRMTFQNNSPTKIKELESKVPLGKLAQPDDIAKTAFYLCSDDNVYITGQNIIADGGYTSGGFEE